MSAAPYDSEESVILLDYTNEEESLDSTTANGVQMTSEITKSDTKYNENSLHVTVHNEGQKDAKAAWSRIGKNLSISVESP